MKDTDTGIYMENETLGNFARNTAAALERDGTVRGAVCAAQVHRTLRALAADLAAMKKGEGGEANEWFRENWYLAERAGKAASAELRSSGRLPRCAGAKRALISEAAAALVRSGRGEVTGERIRLFLDEFQSVRILTEKELSVFVPALTAELCAFLKAVLPETETRDENERAMLFKNIFTSLRALSIIDISDILEEVNRVESALRADPAGIYTLMDEDTRRSYRARLARVARRAGMTEFDAVKKVLELAREGEDKHVGTYIFTRPLGEPRREDTASWYIALVVLATLFFTLLAGIAANSVLVAALTLLPISEIVKNTVDAVALRVVRPRRLPRMELSGGIPRAGKTVCVISALLTSEKDGPKFARLMEEYRLSNRDAGENLLFGILADLREAPQKRTREDGPILEAARSAVEALNEKYGGGFYLLYREREKNSADNIWMGRERKRGAIEELVKLLSGEKSGLRAVAGDEGKLAGTSFILTLDADTRLTAGAARELVGAALHPLNVPVVDEARRRVVSGYGIFEPRVAVDLRSAGKSDFSRLFAGVGGLDPYSGAVSDLYQDLFEEGTFMGKGLVNVPVYQKLLSGAFPDNTILSHDILEGAYMRCAFVSDLELSDGCPFKVTSYFARQERWTRGDWQNLRWCTGRVKTRDGALIKNTLPDIDRWKLVDNLRRSLIPPAVLAALLAALLSGAGSLTGAALTALAGFLSPLIIDLTRSFLRHDGSGLARYHSAVVPGVGGAIMRSLISLMLLPAQGYIQLKAAVTALYRMCVSRRGLLAWVTSSEAERKHGNTVLVNYRALSACPVLGLLLLFAARRPLAAAVGIVWLFAPAYAWALSRERRRDRLIPQSDRTWLLSKARETWRFFEENLTESDNFLPPDNVQTEPDLGPAHRTSPTNIGLALLSTAAASDLGFISQSEAVELAGRTLTAVEKLTKWHGDLLNWYDTRTLEPLEPRYVSTVDSGNLLGSLIALRQWFIAGGEREGAERCERLINDTDLRPLFDERRKLFHIGWDLTKDAPTEGWYDLLASEARQTSFVAVALGQVPRKHWRRLGRALVSQDNYSGMASWTGTMFEYLMPNLLLPCPEDSLIYESSEFCLYAQKRARPGVPWGISESAFYAFDPGLSYRYKAHGVQRLALKRGMDAETVISPYSTCLALPLDPRGAVRNLKRLDGLGLSGRYGFYEAVDFTPARRAGGKPQIVRCFMAHHLGMSLVAIANTLCGGVFQRRFMADERMGAYRELLEERVPTGRVILRQPPRDVPEKPKRAGSGGYFERHEGVDALTPAAVPLSNGQYSVLFAETGASRSRFRELEVTRFDPSPGGEPGMVFYVRTDRELLPLTPAPDFDGSVRYTSEFSDAAGRIRAKRGDLSAALAVSVPPSGAGEIRSVEISAPPELSECEVLCGFTPVLQRRTDFNAHPAFSLLSLEAGLSGGVLTVRRRPRPGERDVYLCVTSDRPFIAATHSLRGEPLGAGELLRSCPDFHVSLAVPVKLSSGRGRVSFALGVGFDASEAADTARRSLARRETQAVSRISAAALMLGMTVTDTRAALELIPQLVFGPEPSERRRELLASGGVPREELWRLGVSGDRPVLCAKIENETELEEAGRLLRRHALLTENGVDSDLVFLLTDGGDYRKAQRTALTEELRRLGREGTLNAPGGVYLADAAEPASSAAEAHADLTVRLDAIPAAPAHRERTPVTVPRYIRGAGEVRCRREPDGAFRFALTDRLPETAWSHVLANEDFGFLATECGAGHMWAKNSRLFAINSWLNDPMAAVGPERLTLTFDGQTRSLFADGSGVPTMVEYGMGWAAWERDFGGIRSRLTAFVPVDVPARVLILELTGGLDGAEVGYFTDLVLGESAAGTRAIVTSFDGEAFRARNPSGIFRNTEISWRATVTPARFTCRKRSALMGEWDGFTGAGEDPCIAWSARACERVVITTGCGSEEALRGVSEGAERHLNIVKNHWKELTERVRIETPDKRIDNYVNRWAIYQTVACRLLARTSIYQNGGATGFRDQLQDACSMTLTDPRIARKQLLLAASRQYREGDVMHWWHDTPRGVMGVRTHCSDDLLWLPWALCDYVNRTGDRSVLHEPAPFLSSEPLKPTDRDRYEIPQISTETASILEHSKLSADQFMARGVGAHGLALMLGGDWNDGMNEAGSEGRGESVWLTLFGSLVLRRLAELCEKQGEAGGEKYRKAADALLRAAENSFDGEWYPRGWYDDGKPFGTQESSASGAGNGPAEPPECEIDSVSQSFARFAGADRSRVRQALNSAYTRLFDEKNRLVRLFDPPFDNGTARIGYIRSYAPGFRENGGQYTHAAVWLAMALLESGQTQRGAAILSALSPDGREERRYAAEPYVIAGDVTSAQGLAGRAGWSWYTGSAGWYFRAVTETLLGLKIRDGRLFVEPALPEGMYPARVLYTAGGRTMDIRIYPEGVLIDGEPAPKDGVALELGTGEVKV